MGPIGDDDVTSKRATTDNQTKSDARGQPAYGQPDTTRSQGGDVADKRVTIVLKETWPIWSGSQMIIRGDAENVMGR